MNPIGDATLWVLEPTTVEGIKISLVICELPDLPILAHFDKTMGVFNDAIGSQILKMVNTLRGEFENNTFVDALRMESLRVMDATEDFLILHFQKDYLRTTSNMVVRYKQVSGDVQFLGNNITTNRFLKDAAFKTKCSVKVVMNDGALYFALNSTKDPYTVQDVLNVKAKIM
ncbi:unnamed protein product [Cunninghamella blakesleeana]